MIYNTINLFYGNYVNGDYYTNKKFYQNFYKYEYVTYTKEQLLIPMFKTLEIRQIKDSLKFFIKMDDKEFIFTKEKDRYKKEEVKETLELLDEIDLYKMLEILSYGKTYQEYIRTKEEEYLDYYYNQYVLGEVLV